MLDEVQMGSKAKFGVINRRLQSSALIPDKGTMAKQLSNSLVPWACVRPPEHSARLPLSGARRMLAKLGELHQPLHPRASEESKCIMGQYMP
jgi:hypothetical protein